MLFCSVKVLLQNGNEVQIASVCCPIPPIICPCYTTNLSPHLLVRVAHASPLSTKLLGHFGHVEFVCAILALGQETRVVAQLWRAGLDVDEEGTLLFGLGGRGKRD